MKKSAGLSENDNFKLSMKINNGLTTLLLFNFFYHPFFCDNRKNNIEKIIK
jgi:hypothetical protein